jgi:hypothetical protein
MHDFGDICGCAAYRDNSFGKLRHEMFEAYWTKHYMQD